MKESKEKEKPEGSDGKPDLKGDKLVEKPEKIKESSKPKIRQAKSKQNRTADVGHLVRIL